MRSELPDWESLRRGIDGGVALPGSPAYRAAPPAFNARFGAVRPAAIVSCTNPQDAAEAIGFARRHGLELATRAGGHSFATHSSTRGVLVDVTPMRSVAVAGGQATVGGGARLGEGYEALQAHDLTIPGGTCPPVGVAGLALGGGLGILGRKYGVTSDHLVGAEVVLADGRVLSCDDHHDQDLFWAPCGAGAGNFGVVTTLVFGAVPAPPVTTNVHLAWPYARAAAVIQAWQGWAELAGLPVGDGLLVNDQLEAVGAAGIHAAGDVAAAWHPRYQTYLRVEHWANALNQGPAAARNMLGSPTAYARLPSFYSDQYDLAMEYSGFAATWDRVVVRGDLATREFLAFWLNEQRVVAGMNANVWDVVEPIQTLIRSGRPVDPERLTDPSIAFDDRLAHQP